MNFSTHSCEIVTKDKSINCLHATLIHDLGLIIRYFLSDSSNLISRIRGMQAEEVAGRHYDCLHCLQRRQWRVLLFAFCCHEKLKNFKSGEGMIMSRKGTNIFNECKRLIRISSFTWIKHFITPQKCEALILDMLVRDTGPLSRGQVWSAAFLRSCDRCPNH